KDYIVHRYPYLNGNYGWLVRDEDRYFQRGLTYSLMASGSMGARELRGSIFDNASPAIFSKSESANAISALLNSRVASYLLRVTTQDLKFREGYVANLPVPSSLSELLDTTGVSSTSLKRSLVSRDAVERAFDPAALLRPYATAATSVLGIVR